MGGHSPSHLQLPVRRLLCLLAAVLLLPFACLYELFARRENPAFLARFKAGIGRCKPPSVFKLRHYL